jgi:lipopolysaccharide biosynthesis glycosyltransferase
MYQVVFAVNDKYIILLSIAIKTLLEKTKNPLLLNVIYSHLSFKNIFYLRRLSSSFNTEINFHKIESSQFIGLPEKSHLTIEAYYRLAIPSIIKAEKVLYLDCDVLIKSDLTHLFSKNLKKFALAAVIDPAFQPIKKLRMKPKSTYFNSGVMLLNLKYWRDEEISKKVLKYLRDNPKKITYADQCALNAIINGNYLALNKKYNFQSGHFDALAPNKPYQNPLIVHFTGAYKPTHYLCKHPFKNEFLRQLSQTPFMLKINLINYVRKFVSYTGTYPLFNKMRNIFVD